MSPGAEGVAHGKLYLDDGESQPPTPYREVEIFAEGGRHGGKLRFVSKGTYMSQTKLQKVFVLVNGEQEVGPGVTEVWVRGKTWESWSWDGRLGMLTVEGVGIDMNEFTLEAVSWR